MPSLVSQNIFDYATSELSQDAFISLLIAWFDSEDEELREISRNFISSLYHKHFSDMEKLEFSKMNSIKIIQQHHKIDVYFELVYDGETIPFIIEDKTWTEPHSKQLSRYVQKISSIKDYPKNQNEKSNKIVKIFFKTGHITEKDEQETNEAKYIIINTKWIYNFLVSYTTNNIIFNNYQEYLKNNFYEKLYNHDNSKKELKDWNYKDVRNGYVQYAIIKNIKNKLVNNDLFTHSEYIKFTRNGKSWDTWWSFDNGEFRLFVKIKKIGISYRIRLIKYSHSKTPHTNKQNNLKKLTSYIDNFLNLKHSTNIEKTSKPRSKVREIEIAYLELTKNISLENATTEFSEFMEFIIDKKRISE